MHSKGILIFMSLRHGLLRKALILLLSVCKVTNKYQNITNV